jgi:aminoglycoside phosphotransferase family enzyme/predicted kinase
MDPSVDQHADPVAAQRPVVALLAESATYGTSGPVERVDTHISHVFLVGDQAIKLKNPVTLPYLDFATLRQRYAACVNEVRLNRRTAPDYYLGIRLVRRRNGGQLVLGDLIVDPDPEMDLDAGPEDENGAVIDVVVVMRRFDQDTLLDRVAAKGKLKRRLVEDLARAVAQFHKAAEPRRDRGGYAAIAAIHTSNMATLREHGVNVLTAADLDELDRLTTDTLAATADVLDARRDAGWVRHCHGDLHLRNIFLDDGRPTLFDAIEFSEDFACIDTLYDLAFLLMDLDHRGLPNRANAAFNVYQDVMADLSGLRALPLFLSFRAVIRAHVALTARSGLIVDGASPDDRGPAGAAAEALDYFARGVDYLRPAPPRLVAVGGLSGTGKSRLARRLAPGLGARPGALVVRSDVIRKRICGVDAYTRLGPEGYTPEISARVYGEMIEEAKQALAGGHAVIADAVHARPAERAAIEAVAISAGVPFCGLWLDTDPKVMEQRVASRTHNASDAGVDVVRRQLGYELGDVTWSRIDSSGRHKETLSRAREILARRFEGYEQPS